VDEPDRKPRILTIERDCDPIEQSAMIMAVMAYPGRNEDAERMHAFEALVARPLYEYRRQTRDSQRFADPRWEAFLELKTEDDAWLISRRISKLLSARSEVGDIAKPWIVDLWKGSNLDLPALTDAVLMDRVSALLKRSPENWLRRTWRPAKPAFHLYAAYQVAHLVLPPEAQDPFNPQSGPTRAPDTKLTRDIINVAMDFQFKLVADPRFPFRESDLIWIKSDLEKTCDEPFKTAPD
jgi:hypothetical protein